MADNQQIQAVIRQAAQRYGVPESALLKIGQIESSFNPAARNPNSSAGGLFQFTNGTARQYGLVNKFDAFASADAAARLARDNMNALKRAGLPVTDGSLYLAHQQGSGGAVKLLSNPNASASSLVGADAVRLNGGNGSMTGGQFANLWMNKAEKLSGSYGGGGAVNMTAGGQDQQQTAPAQQQTALAQQPTTASDIGPSRAQQLSTAAATPFVPSNVEIPMDDGSPFQVPQQQQPEPTSNAAATKAIVQNAFKFDVQTPEGPKIAMASNPQDYQALAQIADNGYTPEQQQGMRNMYAALAPAVRQQDGNGSIFGGPQLPDELGKVVDNLLGA